MASSAAAKESPTLFGLPQEVRDIIFDMAFPEIPEYRIIAREQWERQEVRKCRQDRKGYKQKPFVAKVNDFLVSKSFMVAASRAHIGNQVFEGDSVCRLYAYGDHRLQGIIAAFATRVLLKHLEMFCLPRLRGLHTLTLRVSPVIFECLGVEIVVEEDELNDDQFELAVQADPNIRELHGIRELHVEPEYCGRTTAVWSMNVANFEAYLRPRAAAPKQKRGSSVDDAKENGSDAVYFGSAVRFGTHELGRPGLDNGDDDELDHEQIQAEDDAEAAMMAAYQLKVEESMPSLLSIGKRRLTDNDVPETVEGILHLFNLSPTEMAAWVQGAKKRLGGRVKRDGPTGGGA